jgi:hypothetical protein
LTFSQHTFDAGLLSNECLLIAVRRPKAAVPLSANSGREANVRSRRMAAGKRTVASAAPVRTGGGPRRQRCQNSDKGGAGGRRG